MIPNVQRCLLLQFICAIGLCITSHTVISLIIENIVATKYISRYESIGICVGLVCALVQMIISSVHLVSLFIGVEIEGVVMTYCIVERNSQLSIDIISAFLIFLIQILARVVLEYLFYKNNKLDKGKKTSTLSTRFQIRRNLEVIIILKTFLNISILFLGFHAFASMTIQNHKNDVTRPVYFALVEFNSFHPMLGVISIFSMHFMLKKSQRKVNQTTVIHVKSKWVGDPFDKR
uniref:Serpentine Receptor, class AB (Class A-like) n=1 Tax=Caenorhabditis tropicalis TaxID=1561998 RepID=A0A1I7UBV6_9PELO